jgi:glutamyl-tRNA reductase
MIALEVEDFQAWFKTLIVTPVIKALRQKADQIRTVETAKYIERKLCRLDEREKEAVENLTRSIVNAILKDPIMRMKDNAMRKAASDHIESLLYLFDLEQKFEQDLTGEKKQLVN